MMTTQAATRGQVPSSALSPAAQPVTRFAPSPTGRLHLGHAYSALLAHDFARERGGSFLLRIEDIDGTRSRPEHVVAIIEDLTWLGLDWDGEVLFQSRRLDLYAAALDRLRAAGLLYSCFCTRKDIAASAAAPHPGSEPGAGGPEGPIYPGTCRRLAPAERARLTQERPHAWRLDMHRALTTKLPGEGRGPAAAPSAASALPRGNDRSLDPGLQPPAEVYPERLPCRQSKGRGALVWSDHGRPIPADPALFGDVVLARKDAPVSYHLAVTVDDAAQNITDVVRGEDLFDSTHVHRLLQALLALPTPFYHHHDLIRDAAGRRLAKRHGAPTLAELRAGGADPGELAQMLRNGRLPAGFSAAGT